MRPQDDKDFSSLVGDLKRSLDALSGRRVLLFGGKGGVGKTTLASLAALHFARSREVVLFSTDPASNLDDLFEGDAATLRIEPFDAEALWQTFLEENLEQFVELGDRGTYLDREEIRELFRLAIPGIDELTGWMRIGELADENPEATIVVDTATTGHTLRLLSSSEHFVHFSDALEQMQSKHRALVFQLARRSGPDALDDYLDRFRESFEAKRALLGDAKRTAFVAVSLAEPWVVAQTRRLVDEVRESGIDVPLTILNQGSHDCDCRECRSRSAAEDRAMRELGGNVAIAPRACVPLDSPHRFEAWLGGDDLRADAAASSLPAASRLTVPPRVRILFFAGKGGVGKTSAASSVALQLAARHPDRTVYLVSVDPAHSLRDVFASIAKPGNLPGNLKIELIETKEKWQRLRERLGDEIERTIQAFGGPNLSISHDSEVLRELLETAPPGADEIFGIMRLCSLLDDPARPLLVVDTAPTGHFLRLLDLPAAAGAWVREMMRLLLRYRELVHPGALGEELVEASRALKRIEALLRSEEAAAAIVLRPERIVMAETLRLREALRGRGLQVAGLIVNAITPPSDCACDRSRRAAEAERMQQLDGPVILVERKSEPPVTLDALRHLIPLE